MRLLYLTGCAFALSGCATTSFAPPQVDLVDRLEERHRQHEFWGLCTPSHVRADLTKADGPDNYVRLGEGVDDALALISNYLYTYRCARDRAADGRQLFELPGFLGTAAAGTAVALGAGPTVAIVAGASSATLDHSKQYFAPQAKAQVFNDAVQAMLCIQSEAVGVNPFVLKTVSLAQKANNDQIAGQQAAMDETLKGNGVAPQSNPAFVSVTYAKQYFELVRTALFSVEQAVAQRLSTAGSAFPSSGVLAEYEQLSKLKEDQQAKNGDVSPSGAAAGAATPAGKKDAAAQAVRDAADNATTQGNAVIGQATALGLNTDAAKAANKLNPEAVGRAIIKLDELNTKLQICVLQAKL